MLLAEKNILVTGSAKRVGAEIVRQLAEKGAHVVIHCNTSLQQAQKLLTSLPGNGHKIIQADLSIPEEAQKLFDASPALDAIVNNASLYRQLRCYGCNRRPGGYESFTHPCKPRGDRSSASD